MRKQISVPIYHDAGIPDVFQYCIMRSQQILGPATVAMSLRNNFGHFREKPKRNADLWTDGRGNSGVDHHGHVVSLSCVSVAIFGAVI